MVSRTFYRTKIAQLSRVRGLEWLLPASLLACVFDFGVAATPKSMAQSNIAQADSGLKFESVAEQAGVTFEHTDGSSGQRYVIESMTAGCAVFDYDGDGLLDVYFLNGCPLPAEGESLALKSDQDEDSVERDPKTPRNTLYRNLGNWRFRDVTNESGIGDTGYGLGVAAGDYDNDGNIDLYVTNYGANVLYRNRGDGTFENVAQHAQVGGGERFGAGATWFDMDSDGDLDLYTANYQKFTYDQHIVRMIGGYQFHPGPHDYPGEPDMLYRNDGDGRFTDVSEESGVSKLAATGMGVIAVDVDEDGDIDLFVANDSVPNFLFVNDGTGKFTEDAVLAGVAFDVKGKANGNMGVDAGDANGDGKIDFVTTTYQSEMPVLYQNMGGGLLDDVTNQVGIPRSLFPHVNWGVGFGDFDNDMDLDLFIACGHFMDNIDKIDDRTTMKVRNYLLENDGKGLYSDQSEQSGITEVLSSRGAAIDDLDNDGRLDLVVANFNARASLLRNMHAPVGNWLRIQLVGRQSNRQGVGSLVKVMSAGQEQAAQVVTGRGYQSSYGTTLHFGLGTSEPATVQVQVRWTDNQSTIEEFEVRRGNGTVTLIEGSGAGQGRF